MEEKRTFIMYTDYDEDINFLTNEEAGIVFKSILGYTNREETPEFDDRLLAVIFNRIKRDIDRNTQEWEEKKERRKNSGSLGGKQKQLNIENSGITTEELSNATNELAKPSIATNATNQSSNSSNATNDLANLAVNVNVNDNVNVNVNDNVNVNVKREGQTKFVRPSLEDVKKYVLEKNYSFNPESFFAFYESKGWKVGNNPMKNWQMACVTWENRQKENRSPAQRQSESLISTDGYTSGDYWQDQREKLRQEIDQEESGGFSFNVNDPMELFNFCHQAAG